VEDKMKNTFMKWSADEHEMRLYLQFEIRL